MAQTTKATGPIATMGIELLTYTTPNGKLQSDQKRSPLMFTHAARYRAAIFLEELKEAYNLPFTVHTIDLAQRVQKETWYTSLNPSSFVPTIVDHDAGGYAVMEGMAILNYLVRKFDTEFRFSFEDPLEACTAEQWIAW